MTGVEAFFVVVVLFGREIGGTPVGLIGEEVLEDSSGVPAVFPSWPSFKVSLLDPGV